jgi:NAD+ synthase
MSARTDAIVEWLRQRLSRAGANGFVVGLGGDVESAVAARLCQAASPDHIIAVLLPCHSDPDDDDDAQLVAEHFDIPAIRIDLAPVHDVIIEDLRYADEHLPEEQAVAPPRRGDLRGRMPMANVKPRLRMTTLYFLANRLNYLVAGSINRSELAIGCVTKYGDGGVDVLPIGHLLKSEVFEAAADLGVPPPILAKIPRTGVRLGLTHEWQAESDDVEGFTHDDLETYLMKGADAVAPELATRIEHLIRQNEHKRTPAPAPDLTL